MLGTRLILTALCSASRQCLRALGVFDRVHSSVTLALLSIPFCFKMASPARSPPPQLRDYQRYSEDIPSSGYRPPEHNFDNYFDGNPPAPFRLSGSYISPAHSPSASTDNFHARTSSGGGPGGPRYLSPLAAAEATQTEGAGMRHSNYSEMSMVGLNSTPGLQRKSTWLQKETTYRKKNHRLVSSLNGMQACTLRYRSLSLLVRQSPSSSLWASCLASCSAPVVMEAAAPTTLRRTTVSIHRLLVPLNRAATLVCSSGTAHFTTPSTVSHTL